MKVDVRGLRAQRKHEENLRLKLKREVSPEVAQECKTFSSLEERKRIADALREAQGTSRAKEVRQAFLLEEALEVDGYRLHRH